MFIVLGNITVDEVMAAPAWPAPGQTVVVGAPVRDLGGKGANQAVVLKRAGVQVRLFAAIGEDEPAAWIVERLAAEGMQRDDLMRFPGPSDRSLIFVGPSGENAIASIVTCAEAVSEAQAEAIVSQAEASDVLVLQGNLTLPVTRAACRAARRNAVRTVFNPSPMREGFETLLPLIDLLVLNEGEAAQLAGGGDPDRQVRALHEAGAADVVMTRGSRGAMAFGRSGRAVAPAVTVDAVDTTGAGDTFMGVLAAALFGRNLPMPAAMRLAAAAAALTVARPGTMSAFPSRDEIDMLFRSP